MFPKKSPLQDFIKSTLVFAFRREFRRTFEQQSAPNKVVIWHRTKSIMGHFFLNFFNPFRYDFVHPSWCDFSFGSSTCTAKEQTMNNHFKNTFQVSSSTHFIYTKYFFCHGLWLPDEDFTICVYIYRFCLQRVSMSFSSEVTIIF